MLLKNLKRCEMENNEPKFSRYRADLRHYDEGDEKLSKITLSWVMSYEDWKQTFAENLRRYEKEKEALDDLPGVQK